MPITENVCTNEDIFDALRAHEERIGQIVLDARVNITQLRTIAEDLDSTIVTPIKDTLDSILSVRGITTDELIDLSNIQKGETRAEIEKSLSEFGLSIANGRILATRNADIDLTVVKDLHRLVGSFDKIKALIPELGSCQNSDDAAATPVFNSKFLFIVTYQKLEVIPGVGCKADVEKSTEIVLGIEKPISVVLEENPELSREDLTVYIFWIGKPEAKPHLKARAINFGLTEEEYFDIILSKSTETFKVSTIDKPFLQICVFSSVYGDDVDTILTNSFGKNKTPKVKSNPTKQDILDEVNNSGVLTTQPGRQNSYGVTDYGSLACQFLAVADFEKSFESEKDDNSCLDASADLSSLFEGLFGALNSASNAINTLIDEVVSRFMGLLNKISGIFSIIDSFLLNLFKCFFPAGISVGVSLDGINKLIDLLLGGIELFDSFFSLLDDLLLVIAPIACIKATIADLAKNITNSIPGLSCILPEFSFDVCLNISLDIGSAEADLAFAALSASLNNLKSMFANLSLLAQNFDTNLSLVSCLPVESAVLVTKLGVRAALASAGIPI